MIEYGLGKIMALWICVFGVLVCASSCDSDRVSADGVGKLRLSLSADTTSLNKGINNSTKAAVSDEFEKFLTTADYKIRIVQQSDTVQSYDRFDEMPSEIELKEGLIPSSPPKVTTSLLLLKTLILKEVPTSR